MAQTHTLEVVAATGDVTRKVRSDERTILKHGAELESWKVGELASFEINPTEGTILVIDAPDRGGHGQYRSLPRGGRIEVGDDSWLLSELAGFSLREIPKPPAAVVMTSLPGAWRLTYVDPNRPAEVVDLGSGGRLQGELVGPTAAFEGNTQWGAFLDQIATIERVEEVSDADVSGNGRH